MEDKLLTRAEAQPALRVSAGTMFNMIRNQEIPAMKIGRSYRIKQSDLDNFLRKQEQNKSGEKL